MNCNNCQELFSDYLDRLMEDPQLRPFEKHLEECPDCAEEWECFAEAVNWVRKMQFSAPEGILEGIRRKIAGHHPKESFISRFFNILRFQDFSLPMPVAAATLAVALLTMLAVKHFAAGNLPLFHSQQAAERGNISQSVTASRTGAERYHVPPQSMFKHPGLRSDATFSDFDSLLPLQQLDTQFVTTIDTDGRVPFASDSGFAPYAHTKQPNPRPFHSMPMGHLPPDVRILVNNLPIDNRLQLSRQLLNNSAWSAKHFGSDIILLQMDPCKLKKLHGILAGQNILIMPPDATDAAFGSPKKILTVAIRLR